MKKTTGVLMLLFSFFLIVSCDKKDEKGEVEGLKPIYASPGDLTSIDFNSNEILERPGKIYVYEHYLFVNDKAKGIHIYDKSDNENPTQVSFIAIPGNMDFSIKAGMLYADNVTDMVVIDINQPELPLLVNRIPGVFPVQQTPEQSGAYQCVDYTKGQVVGWEKAILTNPVCYN